MQRIAILAGSLLLAACQAPIPAPGEPPATTGWAEYVNLGPDGPVVVHGWALVNGEGCVEAVRARRIEDAIVLSRD